MDWEKYNFKKGIRQGDLILARFHYSDLELIEKRPAIVISNDNFNVSGQNIVLVPLTSMIRDESSSLIISSEDLSSGRLKNVSVIRLDRIAGLHKKLLVRNLGRVKDSVLNVILNKTCKILEKSI
jgi:mRNA-degrading endonuclease toxin of MazEF toxin-antitoxin module